MARSKRRCGSVSPNSTLAGSFLIRISTPNRRHWLCSTCSASSRERLPAVVQDGLSEIDVDVLINQAGLVDDLERLAVPSCEGQPFIERQAELAGDHVDRARQQIGFERRGVLDRANRDSTKAAWRTCPMH